MQASGWGEFAPATMPYHVYMCQQVIFILDIAKNIPGVETEILGVGVSVGVGVLNRFLSLHRFRRRTCDK